MDAANGLIGMTTVSREFGMTPLRACALLLALASTALAAPAPEDAPLLRPRIESHDLTVELDAAGHTLKGHDAMRVRRGSGGGSEEAEFLRLRLDSGLAITSVLADGAAVGFERKKPADTRVATWIVEIPARAGERVLLSVAYRGTLVRRPTDVTPPGGAVLTDATPWVPDDGSPADWTLRLDLPAHMHGIMPARRVTRTPRSGRVVETWKSTGGMRRLDLTLTPFSPRTEAAGDVTIAWWRTAQAAGTAAGAGDGDGDEPPFDLARSVIANYERRLGPYPLARLDVIQTTSGQSGLTLPGLAVTATPEAGEYALHEAVLAAWLGGALGDGAPGDQPFQNGAWARGLRAYIRFQLGVEETDPAAAREFRDAFCHRLHAGAAPGFDTLRTAAAFHALRREMGDAAFLGTLSEVVTARTGETLTWSDWNAEFSKRAGRDLTAPIEQWTQRRGGPDLRLVGVKVSGSGGRQHVEGAIVQRLAQGESPWRLSVPVVVETIDGREKFWIDIASETTGFTVVSPALALKVALDPEHEIARQIQVGRETVWRPVVPDVRVGSDPRRVTSLMRRLRETESPRRLIVEELRIAGFDVDEQIVHATLLRRGDGTHLVADGTPVVGAFPLTSSPRTPEGGVQVSAVAHDPGDELTDRALLMDLPPTTPDAQQFVRSIAEIAAASGARLLIVRLPEEPSEDYAALWLTPDDVTPGDAAPGETETEDPEFVAMRAQMARSPSLPLPTFIVPHATPDPGTLDARIEWDVREMDATITSVTIGARRGREGDVVVVARIPRMKAGTEDDHSAVIALVEAAQVLAAQRNVLGRNVRIVFVPRGPRAIPADHMVARRRAQHPTAPLLTIGRIGDRGVSAASVRATAGAPWLRKIVEAALRQASVPTAAPTAEAATADIDPAHFRLGDTLVSITSAGPDGPGSEAAAKKIGRVARGIALAALAASIAP